MTSVLRLHGMTSTLLLMGVLATGCGGQPDGSESPAGFLHCAYDAVTGQGDPGNDPSCATSVPADPSAAVVEPGPGG